MAAHGGLRARRLMGTRVHSERSGRNSPRVPDFPTCGSMICAAHFGSWLAGTGASTVVTMRALGHQSINAALVYQRLADDPVREAMQRAVTAMHAAKKPTPKVIPFTDERSRKSRKAAATVTPSRKPKAPGQRYADWILSKGAQPMRGTEPARKWALDDAWRALAKFAGLNDADVKTLKKSGWPNLLEKLCIDLRTDLAEQDGHRASALTQKQVECIAQVSGETASHLAHGHWRATEKIRMHFDGTDDEFNIALTAICRVASAAAAAAANKAQVVTTFKGYESSNMAQLVFLYKCRDIMMRLGVREVKLAHTHSPLIRFASALYEHATGELVGVGKFDRQIDELKYSA